MSDQSAAGEHYEHNEPVSTAYSIHPGLLLKVEILPGQRLTGAKLADAIGVARPGFSNMLNGHRAITPSLAVKIERAIGYSADLLLRLQAAHDLAEARNTTDLAKVERLRVFA